MSILRAPGAIAQLGERLLCKQEVAGSIPAGSTGKCLQISCFRRQEMASDRDAMALVGLFMGLNAGNCQQDLLVGE